MKIRDDLNAWWDGTPLVRWMIGVCVVAVCAYSLWPHEITNFAIVILIVAGGVLDETTWRFWLVGVAGALWAWSHRSNRRRQEAIIELLSDIRTSLDKDGPR